MWARAFALFVMMIAFATPAHAQDGRWLRAESDNFIVYGQMNENQVRQATQSLEDFDRTLRLIMNSRAAPAQSKLEVYLVRNTEELRVVWPGMHENVGGFYRAGTEQIAAFLIFEPGRRGEASNYILFHEYAHHFMLHYFPDAWPRWYVEGWADYVSTTRFLGRTALVGEPSENRRNWMMYGGGLLPTRALLAPERVNQTPEFVSLFYANSWFAVTYFWNHPEMNAKLIPYVEALGRGTDPIEAFEAAFEMTPEAFQAELRDFYRDRIGVKNVRLPEAATTTINVTRMPAAADDLLLRLARMRNVMPEAERATLAAEVEALTERYPDDPMAQIASARAAMLREDYATARDRLTSILIIDEGNAEARYLLARSMLEQAWQTGGANYDVVREARRELVRGFRDDPNYFPTLYLYAATFSGGGEPMTEEHLSVLARALELAPQADDIRLLLGRELITAERDVAAMIILRPLLYAPHGGPAAAEARDLFDRAHARSQATAP